MLLTDTQVSRICKAFANGSSANIKFLKTQFSKMIQSRGFIAPNAVNGTNPLLSFPPFWTINSLANSYRKELKNKDPIDIDSNLLVDTRLDNIGKKIKKGISSITSSGITLTNNKIKDIIKIIRSLENKEIL